MIYSSHAEMTTDIKELVSVNRNKIYEIADTLLEICSILKIAKHSSDAFSTNTDYR